MPPRFRPLLLLVAVALLGCSPVGRARREYRDGRYLEAAERLGRSEAELAEFSPRAQAEYGLYRGLSLLMLGDYGGAHRWLSFAYEVERAEGGVLKDEERAALDRGWAQLGAALARPQVVPPDTVVDPGGVPTPVPSPPQEQD